MTQAAADRTGGRPAARTSDGPVARATAPHDAPGHLPAGTLAGMSRPRPEPAGPGQESVWDYPRPPRLEPYRAGLVVELGGVEVARTDRGWRPHAAGQPPTYYLPLDDARPGARRPVPGGTFCEWKGRAAYFDLVGGADDDGVGGRVAPRAAWTYPDPTPGFEPLAGAFAVMPAAVDRCLVDGEVVRPQAGGFYGGWITPDVVGPFKGEPGTFGW